MGLRINTVDVETYYDRDYSLKKMTIEEYINDPRFQLLMIAIHTVDDELVVEDTSNLSRASTRELLLDYKLDAVPLAGHNLMFDGAVLNWRYGVKPPLYIDTMLMLRAKYRHVIGSCSLSNAAKYFGIGEKGEEIVNAMGKRREDFSPQEWKDFCDYCLMDANLTRILVDLILPDFPAAELKTINRTLLWYTDPVLELDTQLLRNEVIGQNLHREALFKQSGLTEATLSSNPQFASWLTSRGVTPPMKISPKTHKPAFAFAKSDAEFMALQNHKDPIIRVAVEARLRAKSRIKETRMERLAGIGERCGGKLPVPLLYSGARTHRFAGLEKINLQNLTHGDACRGSIRAPKGYKIIAADQAQIEARINAVLSGQHDLVQRFRDGVDNYSRLAERIYSLDYVSKETHPKERKVGKAAFLGCGYGMGADRFFDYMAATDTPVSKLESDKIVQTYRLAHPDIKNHWYFCGQLIRYMVGGGEYQHGPVKFALERVELPGGLCLHYPHLRNAADGFAYRHWRNNRWEWDRLYGPKLVENIVQALARKLLCEQQNILEKRYRVVHQVHDELVFVVPDWQVPEAEAVMRKVMTIPPAWMPSVPLEVEINHAQTFDGCK